MSNFENNKIFAAVLSAGIVFMLTGFVANQIMHPHDLEKDAVEIEGARAGNHGGAIAKPQIPDPIMALIASADVEKGAKISKACAACHSFDKGGATKQGPNLWGIVNTPKAAKAGFAYSDALLAKGGEWDYNALNNFLWKPKKYVTGTKMNFVGLKKPADRAAMIAWLRQQADSQAVLPTDAEIAAEEAAFAPPEEEHAEDGGEHGTDKGESVEDITPHAGDVAEDATIQNDEAPKTDAVHGLEEMKEPVEDKLEDHSAGAH